MLKILNLLLGTSVIAFIAFINVYAQTFNAEYGKLNTQRFNRLKDAGLNHQTSTNFFPNDDGDFWEYVEEDTTTLFGQVLALKFSISREVIYDTTLSNGLPYKKVRWQNEANSVSYPPVFEFLRVDSIGNAYIYYNTFDHILFDFTLDINQTYPSHLTNNYWKVIDKYSVIGFGDTLQAIDFGMYNQSGNIIEKYSIAENFGIYFYQKDLMDIALPTGNFWGAVIGGQEFGTLIVKKQVVDWKDFYPLHIGDYWVYEGNSGSIPITNTVRVIGDTIMPDNNVYFILKEIDHTFGYVSYSYRRIDSLGSVFYWEYWNNASFKYFEFGQAVGDTSISQFNNFNWRLEDKNHGLLYKLYPDLALLTMEYVSGIGLNGTTGEQTWQFLSGAYINGQLHGDTTITSVDKVEFQNPNEYTIYPCYPNPFNPGTTINWQSPESGWQTIKIYNSLGEEIEILVDEYKPAGMHEVQFTANNLPSGVYFYQLRAGEFVQTKKMILMK